MTPDEARALTEGTVVQFRGFRARTYPGVVVHAGHAHVMIRWEDDTIPSTHPFGTISSWARISRAGHLDELLGMAR